MQSNASLIHKHAYLYITRGRALAAISHDFHKKFMQQVLMYRYRFIGDSIFKVGNGKHGSL